MGKKTKQKKKKGNHYFQERKDKEEYNAQLRIFA